MNNLTYSSVEYCFYCDTIFDTDKIISICGRCGKVVIACNACRNYDTDNCNNCNIGSNFEEVKEDNE